MSFAGIVQFDKNLSTMTKSETFKNADDGEKLRMGGLLINSKYGGTTFSQPKELLTPKPKSPDWDV